MAKNERGRADLATDLFRRLDPGGELGEALRAFEPLVQSRIGRGMLRLLNVDADEAEHTIHSPYELIEGMVEAILVFAPVGWAPSSRVPVTPYSEALTHYKQTQDLDAAEALLVDAWNDNNRFRILLKPLVGLGAGYEPLREKFRLRWRLIDKALHHHEFGAYEASVPIVLAQIDGIVWDLTEQRVSFFYGKRREAYLVDDATVAGLPEGLEVLRNLTDRGIKDTGATGALARHGILHGQELGYDTYQNSTKVFVLLLAVLDWATPRARALADRLREQEEAKHAGSDARDQRGRRLDRRGFIRAQEGLHGLAMRQLNEYGRHGQFGDDLNAMFPAPGRDNDIVRNKDEIRLRTSHDRQVFWAWRGTPGGVWFGIAAAASGRNQWLYAETQPPTGGPEADEGWRKSIDPPPDWT